MQLSPLVGHQKPRKWLKKAKGAMKEENKNIEICF
jgi:hypothetical protein